jgi:hypothetical protein
MPTNDARVTYMKYRTLILPLIVHSLTSGCSSLPVSGEPSPTNPPAESSEVTAPPPRVVIARDPELEKKLARTELLLLEKEAQVNELQARLDNARQEVVRAMAKQQSLASRAEAASGMAEAEIALQSLSATAGALGVPEVSRLIKLSNAEFEKQNYAGALYLVSQAKGAAFVARGQVASLDRGSLRAGELAFASPLKLQTATRANVRDGPGGDFKIIFTLPAGALVTGYSHADQWVRITDDSGQGGWIYQNLIGRRP